MFTLHSLELDISMSLLVRCCRARRDSRFCRCGRPKGAQQTLQFHPNLFLELHPYELRERGSSSHSDGGDEEVA